MNCTILVNESSPLSTVVGPLEMFNLANSLVAKEERIEVRLVGSAANLEKHASDYDFKVNASYETIEKTDYLIIAALGPVSNGVSFDQNMLLWINKMYSQGAQVISLCTGAFMLAATSLLDGKEATTHWQFENLFKTLFPKVNLQIDRVVCQQGRLYSSGGANAYQDIILHIIDSLFGKEVKRQSAKLLMLDFSRKCQQSFRTPDVVRRHQDEQVHILQDWLQNRLNEPFSMQLLAEQVNLSDRQIKRKFVKAVGMPPLIYAQYMRIEMAKSLLVETALSVEQISEAISYQDIRFFRALFKRHVGISPSQYRHNFT